MCAASQLPGRGPTVVNIAPVPACFNIHVINFKEASGRFFFHFLEVFEKCIEYIRIFLNFGKK